MATRIWYLIGTLAVGGAERTLVDVANNLDREEFEPTIWTIGQEGPLADSVAEHIPVRSLGASGKLDPRPFVRLLRGLKRDRPEILQSFLYFDNVLARLAGSVVPDTSVITGVRSVPEDRPVQRAVIDRLTLPLSDCIISNSAAGREWILDKGVDPNRVQVVRNGRDLTSYDVAEPPGFRTELGLGSGPVVGTVGRLIRRKGHHDLIAAWSAVHEAHPEAQLVIVGDGPKAESLRQQARRRGVADSVHLLGTRSDVPELLALFDLFVFPSHFEGLPGALLEAMAAGVPIVTTPVDGNSELVEDGAHGIHVPPRDPEALAGGITQLLGSPQYAAELGRAAKARAHSEFDIATMVDGFEESYREQLGSGH